jgi:SAM-dependent methyltransferase
VSFDVSPEAYARFMGRYSEPLAVLFADLALVRPGQRALDVGCGPGALTAELVRRLGPDAVCAVEPSEPFVAAVRRRCPGVDVRRAGAEQLPFGDGVFERCGRNTAETGHEARGRSLGWVSSCWRGLRGFGVTSVDRTAYPRFGRVVSGRELAESFTPTDAEIEWARTRTQDEQRLLALVVWLKSYQRLGYFPKVDDVPPAVIRHVRDALGLAENVELEQAAERTAKRYRELVRARMKVTYDTAGVRQVAEQAIRKAVQAKDNPADLINVALEELVRARCELPGYTTLDAMATAIRTEVNAAFYQAVASRIDMAARARLARLLLANPVTRRSEFDRLKDVAKAASLGKFKQRLELLADIDAIGPTEAWLEGIPPGKIAHFAGEARVTDIADLRKVLNEDKRLTLIAGLVHVVRAGVRDDVVTMFCKRMAAIHQKGRDHLEALREAHRAESERLLGVLGDVLSAVREATVPSGGGDGQDLVPAADTEGAAGGWCSSPWSGPAGWRRCRPRTRQWPPTTATTTCRCSTSTTALTARRCSRWWTRSS